MPWPAPITWVTAIASLVYLAAILLVISLLVNLTALFIVRRFSHERIGGS